MESYIFESIEHQKELPIKVFFASIDSSSFHWHYDYELMLVLKGRINVYMDAQRFTLRTGDIILFNSKCIHGMKKTSDDNICLFVQIHPDMLDSVDIKNRTYNFYLNSANPNIRIRKDYYLFKKTVASIGIVHFTEDESKKYRLKSYVYTLLADLFDYTVYDIQQYAKNVSTYDNPEMFIRIITFIEKNYKSNSLAEDLCKSVGMSQPTLYRFLKNSTGLTIRDVVRSFRTEKAKNLLKATNKNISFISQECGYSNEMTFYRCLHYAFNSMEISRFKVSVDCDKRTEREVFLPHFKDCIDAGAASVMSAYNLYKGVHCGHHDYLLNQVLKKEWGFDGFVMSDFIWGVRDTVEAANGGQDMEMCWTKFFGDNLVKAVKDGLVPEEKINEAALRIVRTVLAFTEADNKTYDKSLIGCKEHVDLALEAAEKGITLIKNDNNTLPLDRDQAVRIAVIGKLADKGNIGDYGSSRVFPEYIVTPLEGIANCAPNSQVIFYNGDDIDHAKKVARSADAVIFVVGYNHSDEGEYVSEQQMEGDMSGVGGDRVKSLGLHEEEIKLVKEVGQVNSKSVAVLIGGNMIMIDEWKDSVGAILMAYYPGMEGGTAIAKILFGDVNPSGKLPFVIPHKESDLPQVNWDTDSQWYEYYHGYARLEKNRVEPSVPYGFGLSYTTFKVENANFRTENGRVVASCDVSNTGSVAGDEVIQLYIGFKNSKIDRPVKLLRGFARVHLEPNEKKNVTITCSLDKCRWYNPDTNQWELEHMEYETYIGTSSSNRDLIMGTFSV